MKLGEITKVGAGQGAPQGATSFGAHGNPFIRAGSLDALCADGYYGSLERVDPLVAAEHRLCLYAPDTIIFAKSGMSATKNRVFRLTRPAYVVNHLATIQPTSKICPEFLRYWLVHFNPSRLIKDSAYPSISQEDIEEVEIDLPPLPHQMKVSARLRHADHLRRMHRHAVKMSDELVPQAFLQIFGDPASNPHSYPVVPGEELFEADRGGAKCGPFGSALKNSEYVAAGIPVWTMENVQSNRFTEEGCLYITDNKFQQLRAYAVQDGDILISRAGTVGRMALVRTRHDQSIMHSNLIRLALNRAVIIPEYFVVLMTWFGVRIAKLKTGQEDAYTFMNTGALAEVPIPLPPLADQKAFLSFLQRHERLRAIYAEALRQADHLFQTLLHQAFAGR